MDHSLPRITIQYCTQCKWMLRAAYLAQELLSTFSTSLGEVALQPSTGGTFIITLYVAVEGEEHKVLTDGEAAIGIQTHELWDRKKDGGFPETKILKRRVRDVIAPERNLGHVDGHAAVNEESTVRTTQSEAADPAVAETSTVANIDVQPSLGAGIPSALRTDAIAKTDWERGASSRTFTPMDIDTSTPGTRVASQSTRGDVDVAAADRCVDGDCE